ncbi:MAG: hypothetical protein EZS28_027119 [Streblomastix strix]|uniref:Uncharacterized protein n=1 Tax=Streblomastix strix TaxID=222440 RepID=A0A5J4V4T9_9EUKA|nr:MAG: hypothetical protein EZS28_027119 [Streblomastix strix]
MQQVQYRIQETELRFQLRESDRDDEEKGENRDLENRESDNGNEETLDRNGGINREIFRIIGDNQHERIHSIRIHPPVERQFEYQQPIMLVKDDEVYRNRRRSEGVQDNVGRRIEREYCNTNRKRTDQMIQPNIHEKESKEEMEKDTGCQIVEQIDCRLPLQDARFDRDETNNQTWGLGHFTRPLLRISPPNSPN